MIHRHRPRTTIRQDEIAGFGAGATFASALAAVGGGTIVAIFAGWLWLAARNDTDVRPGEDVMSAVTVMMWWGALWAVLSIGLLVALWLAFRAWYATYPIQQRREAIREQRAAVATATAILEEHRSARAGGSEREPEGQ